MNKLFISHASEDKEFVRMLTEGLDAMQIPIWLDEQEILSGDSIPQKINDGLRTSSHGVLVLSPSYLRDDKVWTWEELWSLINLESVSGRRMLIPIRLGLDHAALTQSVPLIAHRLSIDFLGNPKGAAEEIALVVGLNRKLVRAVSGEKLPEQGLPTRHNIPKARPSGCGFVGREALLASVTDHLTTTRQLDLSALGILVFSGIPASGKSTVACELSYRLGRQFPGGVLWFDCRSEPALRASVKAIARLLELDPSVDDEFDHSDNIRAYVENYICFVVFDALDSEKVESAVAQLMPKTGLSRIAITTRTGRLDSSFKSNIYQVTELDAGCAFEVLAQFHVGAFSADQEETIHDICRELGLLPLALQLAARYLRDHAISLSDYLGKLRKRGPTWKGLASNMHSIPSLVEVLRQCVGDIESQGKAGALAVRLLRRCAAIDLAQGRLFRIAQEIDFLNQGPFSLEASVGVYRKQEEALDLFDNAVRILERVGLVRLNHDSVNGLWAHALTLQFARSLLDREDAEYLYFRIEVEWYNVQRMMSGSGWINYLSDLQCSVISVIPLMKAVAPDIALRALKLHSAIADFCDDESAEKFIDEGIAFAISSQSEYISSTMIVEFRIEKAYLAYKAGRLADAEKLYESLRGDLNTIGAETDTLADSLFYFGCLLLELDGEERAARARKIWTEAIEMLIDELALKDDRRLPKAYIFSLKLRLCRLLQSQRERFAFCEIDNETRLLEHSLLADLATVLGGDMSWERQFLMARGPLRIKMHVRLVRRIPVGGE